ncbi:putative phage integrase protein [Salmonella enterica subsp. salamae serovar Greenside]|nr:putative phage integrase protein [Salmonella enterica subsp. salamae serovar Greenside]
MKNVPSFTASAWLERYEVILEQCALKPNTMKVRRDGRKPGPLTPDGLTLAFPTVRDSTGLKFGPNPPSFHEIRSLAGHLYESERGGDFAQRLLSHKNFTYSSSDQTITAQYSTSFFHWGASDTKCPCRRRLNSDANKSNREKLSRWLVSD